MTVKDAEILKSDAPEESAQYLGLIDSMTWQNLNQTGTCFEGEAKNTPRNFAGVREFA